MITQSQSMPSRWLPQPTKRAVPDDVELLTNAGTLDTSASCAHPLGQSSSSSHISDISPSTTNARETTIPLAGRRNRHPRYPTHPRTRHEFPSKWYVPRLASAFRKVVSAKYVRATRSRPPSSFQLLEIAPGSAALPLLPAAPDGGRTPARPPS